MLLYVQLLMIWRQHEVPPAAAVCAWLGPGKRGLLLHLQRSCMLATAARMPEEQQRFGPLQRCLYVISLPADAVLHAGGCLAHEVG